MDEEFEPGSVVGRRGRSRLHVRLPARITTRTRTLRGILRDISLTGAGLELAVPLAVGDDALIEWGPFDAFGRIVHMGATTCGIRFDECVLPSVLVATRDLDDRERLPGDKEIVREVARNWVQGVTRL